MLGLLKGLGLVLAFACAPLCNLPNMVKHLYFNECFIRFLLIGMLCHTFHNLFGFSGKFAVV